MKFYDGLGPAMEHLTSRGAFLTVKSNDGTVNTMTISWGYVGFSWQKPFFVAMVRPSRYTHDLIEQADSFTISIPYGGEKMGKALAVCGSTSGRDTDKEQAANIRFAPAKLVSSPVVGGCDMYYECAITYTDTIHIKKLPADLRDAHYPGDYHDLFYGEIVEAYQK